MREKPKQWTWEEWKKGIKWHMKNVNIAFSCFHINTSFMEWQENHIEKLEVENKRLADQLVREKHLKLHLDAHCETIDKLESVLRDILKQSKDSIRYYDFSNAADALGEE